MKKTVLALSMLLSAAFVHAQKMGGYTFSYATGQPYTPLTGGTNLTAGLVWDDENVAIPVGFSFKIGDSVRNNFIISNHTITNAFPSTDTQGVADAFVPISADLVDRGHISGVPQSPIRYELTGTAPSRIFKVEVWNAGFLEEEDSYSTLNDSVNLQVWIYESTNVIEVRYGTSQVSHGMDYFVFDEGPVVGYAKRFDPATLKLDNLYYLVGNPAAPTIDSNDDPVSSVLTPLNTMPNAGTVYRFTPLTTSIGDHAGFARNISVYPSPATDMLFLSNSQPLTGKYTIVSVTGIATNIQGSFGQGKNGIDVSSLATGMYFVQVFTNEGTANYKFVKQ